MESFFYNLASEYNSEIIEDFNRHLNLNKTLEKKGIKSLGEKDEENIYHLLIKSGI